MMEAQGKTLIQQRAKLEAAAHARQQELVALQLEVTRLRKEIRDWELEREVTELEDSVARSLMSLPSSPQTVGKTIDRTIDIIKLKLQYFWLYIS